MISQLTSEILMVIDVSIPNNAISLQTQVLMVIDGLFLHQNNREPFFQSGQIITIHSPE